MNRTKMVMLLICLALLGALGCSKIINSAVERAARNSVDYSDFDDGKLHIIMCGTGSPISDADHLPACIAIIVDGQMMLIDTGAGAASSLLSMNLPLDRISKVFITHLHSDHIADLGQVINRSWIFGRAQPLEIYGPQGIRRVVDGFEQVYASDAGYRAEHHGEDLLIENRKARAIETAFGAPDEAVTIFKEGDLKVSSFLVDHAPVKPAVGYRFEYKGKVLVISGDTILNENVERYSKDADILIHEAMNKEWNARLAKLLRGIDDERIQRSGRMLEDTLSYHIDTAELGELAQRAGVKKLVLTHLVPPPRFFPVKRAFKKSVAEAYKGELILGEDGMRLEL